MESALISALIYSLGERTSVLYTASQPLGCLLAFSLSVLPQFVFQDNSSSKGRAEKIREANVAEKGKFKVKGE